MASFYGMHISHIMQTPIKARRLPICIRVHKKFFKRDIKILSIPVNLQTSLYSQ